MAWLVDWFALCDQCGDSEYMDGATLTQAKRSAQKKGWQLGRGKKCLCPDCYKAKVALGMAEKGDER